MLGKIIGGVLGMVTLGAVIGPLGAVLGVIAGHFFDLGMAKTKKQMDPEQRARVEQAFFESLFPILGYLAKADGRVSEEEIRGTEELIIRMGLDASARAEAIRLFQEGKEDGFSPDPVLQRFNETCFQQLDVKRIFLMYLITLALADGVLHENEESVLARVSEQLGFSRFSFNQLIGMVKAQSSFRQRRGDNSGYSYYEQSRRQHAAYSDKDELVRAYAALGVKEETSDAELKKIYRKLMSQNHPDKLSGQGVPDEVVKLATERSQEIQTAYELIKKHRKG